MQLQIANDLLALTDGEVVSKRNLFDLIQLSKVPDSVYWSGSEFAIGNTPQQGINWIGVLPNVHAVIIKTKDGAYPDDGWKNDQKNIFQYSFKARNGKINLSEKANAVLIKQPQYLYPILLFTDSGNSWVFEGRFNLVSVEDAFIVLGRFPTLQDIALATQDEWIFQEGNKKYATHLVAERSRGAVSALKSLQKWTCEICEMDFFEKYGVQYIEAHHKIPISTFNAQRAVKISDLALLCPNCHKATHIHMKNTDIEFEAIKKLLRAKTSPKI